MQMNSVGGEIDVQQINLFTRLEHTLPGGFHEYHFGLDTPRTLSYVTQARPTYLGKVLRDT